MRFLLLPCIMLAVFTASSQQSQSKLLNDAYQSKSTAKLKLFIDRWAKNSALSAAKWSLTKNDTIKAFNEVYRLFYLNENSYLAGSDKDAEKRYIVVEDKPLLVVTDTLPIADPASDYNVEQDYEILAPFSWKDGNHEMILHSYIPVLLTPNVIVLSLTKEYDSIIEGFITVKPGEKLKNEYGEPLTEEGHNELKVRFLSSYLPMVKRHWGNYWNYLSYPNIKRIVFDKKFTTALVSYSLSSRGGLACYKKTEQGWRLVDQRTLYIQ